MKKTIISCYWCGLIVLLLPAYGHAYIDPGTGSVILQGLAAGVVAIAAFWRNIRSTIRNFLNNKDRKDEKN